MSRVLREIISCLLEKQWKINNFKVTILKFNVFFLSEITKRVSRNIFRLIKLLQATKTKGETYAQIGANVSIRTWSLAEFLW